MFILIQGEGDRTREEEKERTQIGCLYLLNLELLIKRSSK